MNHSPEAFNAIRDLVEPLGDGGKKGFRSQLEKREVSEGRTPPKEVRRDLD